MTPDAIGHSPLQLQRERVKDAYVAWRFACHFTQEILKEDPGPRHLAAADYERRRLAEYRFEVQKLEQMEREQRSSAASA